MKHLVEPGFGLGLAIAVAIQPVTGFAQVAVPSIEITPSAGGITVAGILTGMGAGKVHARMTIDKSGPAGTVATSQSRQIDVSNNSREVIGTTGLSFGPEAYISVGIVLTDGGTVIGEANTTLGPRD